MSARPDAKLAAGEVAQVDRGALLSALVLAPATFARNRFFSLFSESSARKIRARAALLRTIVRQLGQESPRAESIELTPDADGRYVVRYTIRHLSLHRTSLLDRLELALVRFGISRRARSGAEPLHAALELTSDDRALVYGAIGKLGEKLVLPPGLSEKDAASADGEYHPATIPPGES
jgi:hypothetical protein